MDDTNTKDKEQRPSLDQEIEAAIRLGWPNGPIFHFHREEHWGYPQGLAAAILHWLDMQYVRVIASTPHADGIFVEGKTPNSACKGVWFVWDNGGELGVEKANDSTLYASIPLTSTRGMPSDVNEYALLIVTWLLATFAAKPIDYDWRPPHLAYDALLPAPSNSNEG